MISLLSEAYGVTRYQVIGPGWIADPYSRNLYVIDAKMPEGTTKEQFRIMLQNLLKERLHLGVHHEVRSFPGYDLVVAARGVKLKPAGSLPVVPSFPGRDSARWELRQTSMAQLIGDLPVWISESLGVDPAVRVRDKTGLTGRFDGTLEYSCVVGCGPPELRPRGSSDAAAQGQPTLTAETPAGRRIPDIAIALEEQLGLKLVREKSIPVDVIVVDQLSKTPTSN
jgi:uncharacterized protein (TIGR03435 family)